MKRTLKRGLKVREIAKREAIGFSMGVCLNQILWLYNGGHRGLVYIDSYDYHEAIVRVLLLTYH